MTAPAWARSLVASVCADAGVAQPRLSWRRRAGEQSTGVTRRHRWDRCRPRRGRRARPAPDAPPRAGPLARAAASPRATSGPPRPRVLRHRVRALPTPRPERCRCAAPRVGSLPELASPCGRAGGTRRGCRAGDAIGPPSVHVRVVAGASSSRSTPSGSSGTAAGPSAPPAGSAWSASTSPASAALGGPCVTC